MEFSVIVPAYQAQGTLENCLQALKNQSVDPGRYEIIVVDDGSTDETAQVAEQFGVRVIRQANAGPAAARNHGVRGAQGQIVLFTDADCAPAPDWIEHMTAPFDKPGVAGAKGVYRTRQRGLVPRFVQLEYETKYARMAPRERIDFVDTYSAAYRRDVFLANGGFDTRFPTPSVEDQEFSFRLAREGNTMVFVPQAAVYHLHDANLGQYWRRKFGIGYWKALLLRLHPERAIRDSHTPQSLKLQIGLMGLSISLLPVGFLWAPAWWVVGILAALFALSAIPFLGHIARRDSTLALMAPLMLATRALASGAGLTAGFLRFHLEHGLGRLSKERPR